MACFGDKVTACECRARSNDQHMALPPQSVFYTCGPSTGQTSKPESTQPTRQQCPYAGTNPARIEHLWSKKIAGQYTAACLYRLSISELAVR